MMVVVVVNVVVVIVVAAGEHKATATRYMLQEEWAGLTVYDSIEAALRCGTKAVGPC